MSATHASEAYSCASTSASCGARCWPARLTGDRPTDVPEPFEGDLGSDIVTVPSMQQPRLLRWILCLALLSEAWAQTPPGVAAVGKSDDPVTASEYHSAAIRRVERSLQQVQPLLEHYGYGASVVAVMAEGIGIPLPGQTLLIASSLEAAAGRMNIVLVLLFVTASAVIGNSIGYAIGRWGGRTALTKLKVNAVRLQHLEGLFERRGGLVILVARFVDGLRQLNGIVAGVLKMPWWAFTAYNVAGAILWTSVWSLGAYYLGRDVHVIADFFHQSKHLLYALSAIAVVALVAYLLRRQMRGDSLDEAPPLR
ncbi:MAG: hypothetical protein C5B48_14005 [Candidatus Rokuibacteriota bacterium]|nr:MAG: hypothetical protein C5B48_14005 [Candidatus Rokubacteria bacterium]